MRLQVKLGTRHTPRQMSATILTPNQFNQHSRVKLATPGARFAALIGLLVGILATSSLQQLLASSITDPFQIPFNMVISQPTTNSVRVMWRISQKSYGEMIFNLTDGQPLIQSFATSIDGKTFHPIATQLDPVMTLTVGERDKKTAAEAFRGMVFFEKLNRQPHQSYPVKLKKDRLRFVKGGRERTTVCIGTVTAGSFSGEMQFTFYPGSPFVHAETVLTTKDELRAIVYDAGLSSVSPDWQSFGWMDPKIGDIKRRSVSEANTPTPMAVKYRAMVAEGKCGSIAVFALPHRYFYPLDEAENLKFTWFGDGYREMPAGLGFGIRQPLDGDNRYVPWFDAPAGVEHRLGVFYLLTAGDASAAIADVASYTREDHFKQIPGRRTFTSHYHVEHSFNYLSEQAKQKTSGVPKGLENPGFIRTFKNAGVEIVHLAEFHAGETPGLKTPDRLKKLKVMHDECARLSDDKILLLPGEEPNVHLGGHWISFFPKPVNWVLNRSPGEPFMEVIPGQGKVYHVGNKDDVLKLMESENGLMWTAHGRIKASRNFPDNYRNEEFYKSDHFLGAAWKAMPANLSRPTLGWRVLDLFDDMNNWGQRKQVLGEVDVFRLEPEFEFYGHANINYLKLDRLPKFSDGWQPVLDALRQGEFFTTTGEILIPKFTIGDKESGQELSLTKTRKTTLHATLEWTYPLVFAEVVMGDGETVHRQRVDLSDTRNFGEREILIPLDLDGMKWARLEVWDIAANGAFTQPIWITSETK